MTTNRYPWADNTTSNTADQDDPRYETPGGAQQKVDSHVSLTTNIADRAVTQPKIAYGAVGGNQLDPALLQNYGDIAVQGQFQVVNEQLADKVTYKKVYVSEHGVPGDNNFWTIAELFPEATLAEVQALNSAATLSNSADWYVIQKLINSAEENSAIIVDGLYVVDLPILFNKSLLTLEGKTHYRWQWGIRQIGANQSLIKAKGSYQAIRNLYLVGTLDSDHRSLHGIEIYGVEVQSDHLQVENCYIQGHGGNGIHSREGSLILSRFKDSIVYNCYDNGIYFYHTPEAQQNALMFDNVDTYHNGLELVGGVYQRYTTPDPSRGHGMSVSGVAISVIGGDSSENASAGVHIQDGYYTEGFFMTGRFFENNLLANFYNEGRKAFNLAGNYMYPAFSTLGNIYNKYPLQVLSDDVGYEVLDISRHTNKPIQTYTHTTNKVVYCTSISSNAFVSAGHGLVNGDRMYPIVNYDVGPAYPPSLFPSGIYNRGEAGLFVINATTDQFQLSETSGGSAITITGGGDVYDLNTWHFEVNPSAVTYVTNLYVLKPRKIRAKVRGRFLAELAPSYMLPVVAGVGTTPNWVQIGQTAFGYPINQIAGDIYVDLDVTMDGTSGTNKLVVNVQGYTINTAGLADELKTEKVDKTHIFMSPVDGFDGIEFTQCYFANGTTVDIYLD